MVALRINKRKKVTNIIRIVISLSLISLLIFRNLDALKDIINILGELNIFLLALGISFYTLTIVTSIFRWDIMLRAQNVNISNRYLLQSVFIAFLYSNLFPTNIGGDAYRVYDLYKNKNVTLNKNISAIVMERFMGMLSGTIYLLISLFLGMYNHLNRYMIIGLFILSFVIILIFFILIRPKAFKIDKFFKRFKLLSKLEPKFNSFHKTFISYKYKVRFLLICFGYSLLIHMVSFISFYFVSLSIKLNLSFFSFFFIIPVITLVTNIPISIGGIGVRENTLVFILKKLGVAADKALYFSLIILFIIILNALLGGLVYFFKNIFYKSKGIV